jgi:uncharacterized protein YutE (UPF0331/DUF86 family)
LSISTAIRKALVDNLDSTLQEIFGEKLLAKAVECSKPCLELLVQYLADRACLTKDALKSFKKSLEEASLVTTALPNGASIRACLDIVKEFLMMASYTDGPDKTLVESKYQFIKEAKATKSRSEEDITSAIQRVAALANMEVDVSALVSLYGELVARAEESFDETRKSFLEKLEEAKVTDVKIPPEVDSIASVTDITQDFLAKFFDMKVSVAVSEKTIAMTQLLRDIKLACSYMGTDVGTFIDTTQYEINNREGLGFLYPGKIRSFSS